MYRPFSRAHAAARCVRSFASGRLSLAALVSALALAPLSLGAGAAAAASFSDAEKAEIEEIVKTYLIENPEVMIEVFDALEAQQAEIEQAQAKSAIAENAEALYDDPMAYVYGNPDAEVTIVEFFDYRCGYCKKAFPGITEFIANNTHVKLILKEFPILGEQSVFASKAALAAQEQGKYWELHSALMETRAPLSEENVYEIAEGAGLDLERLKKDMQAKKVTEAILDNEALAEVIGVRGTPAFIVNGELQTGALPTERLQELVDAATKG